MKSIAVLISGRGSNLEAILDAVDHGCLNVNIDLVISNKADAHGLEHAKKAGVPAFVIDNKEYAQRESFDLALAETLDIYNPDFIALAGFMRILSQFFVEKYRGKIINIHPSLLPKYPGMNTHQSALENGDKEHGCSIHFVTATLDGGPVIAQSKIEIEHNDTIDSLREKVLEKEHRLYPAVLNLLSRQELQLVDNSVVYQGTTLEPCGMLM